MQNEDGMIDNPLVRSTSYCIKYCNGSISSMQAEANVNCVGGLAILLINKHTHFYRYKNN